MQDGVVLGYRPRPPLYHHLFVVCGPTRVPNDVAVEKVGVAYNVERWLERHRPLNESFAKLARMATVKIFGEAEPRVIEQLERCASVEEQSIGVLCADNHLGYSQPIGGVVAYEEHISPSGVGYDIACGNAAAKTHLKKDDIEIKAVMDEINRRISFGIGRSRRSQKSIEDPVLDKIEQSPVKEQAQMIDLAYKQLGTVGSGNHYIDIFHDEDDYVWVGVHFGSRGFGHKTASGFMALAQNLQWGDKAAEGEMDSPPILFKVDSELGQYYIEAMQLAGDYAYAGRNFAVSEVMDILGSSPQEYIHNHHNYAWLEEHAGRKMWVVRKGATPAGPGVRGFVGGSMGDISVILEGVDTPENAEGLYSTVHGAGRVMSRTQARGKVKRRQYYQCDVRGCSTKVMAGDFKRGKTHCPDHPTGLWTKRYYEEVIKLGAIDWMAVRKELDERGIYIVGGGADEAPGVYKRLPDVLAAHGDTIRILHTLTPMGVAMAGADVFDPYKD
jgi:tRNA-splicing ligase RtcB